MNPSVAQRLLLVLPSLERGGAERVLLGLAAAFVAAGHDVHLATLLAGGPLRTAVPPGVVLHELVDGATLRPRALWPWLALLRLRRLFASLAPSAVLSTVTGASLLTLLTARTLRRPPRIVVREASGLMNAASPVKRHAMRLLYPHADAIVAVSAGVADDLRSLDLPSSRLHVILNPVDAPALRVLAATGPALPEMGTTPYLLALGRLTPAKDYPTLLHAYAASPLRTSHRLVLLGEGPERIRLEALAARLGLSNRVLLPGALANPFHVLRDARLLVLSSRWEGCPNVLLEALALGVPVVATDCPHGPAELLDGGRLGRLVPPGDVAALAAAMAEACAHPIPPPVAAVAARAPARVAGRYLAVLTGPPA